MVATSVEVAEFLESSRASIVDAALQRLVAERLASYERAGDAQNRQRLDLLLGHVIAALRDHTLQGVVEYSAELARSRYQSGHGLAAVQAAFNALEEAAWLSLATGLPAKVHASALAHVATVFGAGKDALGRAYAALAAEHESSALDVSALFAGTN